MKNRGCLFWLIVGGAGLFVLAFVATGIIALSLINSEASQTAERLVDGHPDLAEFIGSPMSVDWLRTGSITTNAKAGAATFTLTVGGPRGEVNVRVLLVRAKDSDVWEPVYAAVVDGQGRSSLSLDPNRIPPKTTLVRQMRDHLREKPVIGGVGLRLDENGITIMRSQR